MESQAIESIANESNKIWKEKTVKKKSNTQNKKHYLSAKTLKQISEWVKKYKKYISIAKSKQMNESDTSMIVADILSEITWFDKLTDITSEYKIKGQFCDYGIKYESKLHMLIEIKQISFELNEWHLYQVTSYAWNEWVKWVILTNLQNRQLYAIFLWEKIEKELLLSIDVLSDAKWNDDKIVSFFEMIHKESIKKKLLEKLLTEKTAWSKTNIVKIIMKPETIKYITKQLEKSTKVKIPVEHVHDFLRSSLDTWWCQK